ncbi:unnamed protein product [Spirodela intermedia]|uniref:Uncharacterized protein n=1 Tax=Spirodela intermedia TaxID=51605 RepID=A0ABN7E9T4_SPIIN|nr:unnamed protein product [Spirodela intermedia]
MKTYQSTIVQIEMQSTMPIYYDNQMVIFIANNPTFYLRTMYIEIVCHVIYHRLSDEFICTPQVASLE